MLASCQILLSWLLPCPRGGSLWWFHFVGRHPSVANVLIFQLFLVCFFLLDLRSCFHPLHASLCVVVQCILQPVVASLYVRTRMCMDPFSPCALSSCCSHPACMDPFSPCAVLSQCCCRSSNNLSMLLLLMLLLLLLLLSLRILGCLAFQSRGLSALLQIIGASGDLDLFDVIRHG